MGEREPDNPAMQTNQAQTNILLGAMKDMEKRGNDRTDAVEKRQTQRIDRLEVAVDKKVGDAHERINAVATKQAATEERSKENRTEIGRLESAVSGGALPTAGNGWTSKAKVVPAAAGVVGGGGIVTLIIYTGQALGWW